MGAVFNPFTGNFDLIGEVVAGGVTSVNGDTGIVVLDADDVGAANQSLSNLASVAINQSLVPDTGDNYVLGTFGLSWNTLYVGTIISPLGLSVQSPGIINVNTTSIVDTDTARIQLQTGYQDSSLNSAQRKTGDVYLYTGGDFGDGSFPVETGKIQLVTGTPVGGAAAGSIDMYVPGGGTGGGITLTSVVGNILLSPQNYVDVSTGDILISMSGKGLQIKTGTDCKLGTAFLVGGTVTVANTSITANSIIFLTSQVDGGVPGFLRITATTIGTSFVITSSSVADTSTVGWVIVETIA